MATFKDTNVNDTGFLELTAGTTAQRPGSPSSGDIRFNSTENCIEFYDGTEWILNKSSIPIPNAFVSFYENRNGATIGTVDVYLANSSGGLITSSLYSASGDNGDTWVERTPISASVSENFRVVWHYVSGSSFTGDYAIDEVTINGTTYDFDSTDGGFISPRDLNTANSVTAYNDAVSLATATGTVLGRWNRNTGGTPSGSTGPSSGFGGSGYYVYAETSSPNFSNVNFWLFSPEISI